MLYPGRQWFGHNPCPDALGRAIDRGRAFRVESGHLGENELCESGSVDKIDAGGRGHRKAAGRGQSHFPTQCSQVGGFVSNHARMLRSDRIQGSDDLISAGTEDRQQLFADISRQTLENGSQESGGVISGIRPGQIFQTSDDSSHVREQGFDISFHSGQADRTHIMIDLFKDRDSHKRGFVPLQ